VSYFLVAVCAVSFGCGRVGFYTFDDAMGGDGRSGDGGTPAIDAIDAPMNAVTVTFGERATATFQGVTRDTFISNEAGEPTLNYGITDELRSESDVSERILLSFDVSAIPPGTAVFSASLQVIVTQANPLATWELHPVLENWDEGSQDGTSGTSNFTLRMTGVAWSNAGANIPTSSGPTFTTAQPAALGALDIPIPASVAQTWVNNVGSNYGFAFFNTHSDTARFASREIVPATSRPLLTVTYVP